MRERSRSVLRTLFSFARKVSSSVSRVLAPEEQHVWVLAPEEQHVWVLAPEEQYVWVLAPEEQYVYSPKIPIYPAPLGGGM